MSQSNEFVRLLDERIDAKINPSLRWGTVHAVNWKAKLATVNITADDELPLYGVQLGLGATTLRPKKGSACLVLLPEKGNTGGYLLAAQELEGVQLFAQGEELRTVIEELINTVIDPFMSECAKIIVLQGTTINKAEVLKLQQKLTAIKKRFNKLFITD